MKITGGAYLTETLVFRTLARRAGFGPFPDLNTARRELLQLPGMPRSDLADFGRGGVSVRRMMLAALLTAWDAGGELPENTGVFGWNGDGCTAENLAFWRDYVECGRTAGRGNLFVATLPTIPYCEAAIALRCRGAAAYLRTAADTSQLWTALGGAVPGRYLCGELTRDTVCVLLVDTLAAGDLPGCRTLAEVFSVLEAGK